MTQQLINGRYLLHEPLGQGGMGIVHRATDRLTGETVALKQVFLPVENLFFASRPASHTTRELRLALAHEFQTLASMRHPHIIAVLDYGFDESERPFFTMPYLENAQTILEAGNGRSTPEKVNLLIQMLEALAYLHRRGILHRDLKPDNVLVVGNTVRVLDFGLAAAKEQATDSVGSWQYMAPEVLQGEMATETADLYAVGVLAFHLLAGEHPFNLYAPDVHQKILSSEPKWHKLGVGKELTAVIRSLLAKNPSTRYQTATETIATLNRALGKPLLQETAVIRESYLQAAKFVGRQAEMAQLTVALEAAARGNGSAWLIGGESGVGKSRLVHELQTQALVAGFAVLRGQAVANSGGLPYQIWREPLRHLLVTTPKIDDSTASILLPLVPDIAQLLGRPVLPAPHLKERAAQHRLFGAIAHLFQQQEHPILLIAEDLHWTRESLTIFPYLTKHIAQKSLLILGTYRNDEQPNLFSVLSDMTSLTLNRLATKDVALMSQSMLGEAGSQPELLAMLQRETEGNAFFLVEVVRALAEEVGQLGEVGQMKLPRTLLPEGIRTIVQRRLSQIPQAEQGLLRLAAVAGRELDLALIGVLNKGASFDSWLSTCAAVAVLEVQNGRWRFSHDKIREGLLAELPASVLRTHHKQVAQGLEMLYATHEDYAAQLAYHWQQAGNSEKERLYSLAASQLAARQYRNDEALDLLQRAYHLTSTDNLADKLNNLMAQGDIYHLLGRRVRQAEKLGEMIQLAQQLTDPNLLAEVMIRQVYYDFAVGKMAHAEKNIVVALENAQAAKNVTIEGIAHRCLGNVYFAQGLLTQAAHHYERSLVLHETNNDKTAIAFARENLGGLSIYLGHHIRSRKLLDPAPAFYQSIHTKSERSHCLAYRAYAALHMGALTEALTDGEESLVLAEATGDKVALGMALSALAHIALFMEDDVATERWLERAIITLREANYLFFLALSLRLSGQYAFHRQAHQLAMNRYRASLQIYRSFENEAEIVANEIGLARIALAIGGDYEAYLARTLAYVAQHPSLENSLHPFTVYLNTYHCLSVLQNSQAKQMIIQAYRLLQQRADQFKDKQQKQKYLTTLPEHKEIRRLYREMLVK